MFRLHQLLSYTPELNMSSLTELEFISNFQAIQVINQSIILPYTNQSIIPDQYLWDSWKYPLSIFQELNPKHALYSHP